MKFKTDYVKYQPNDKNNQSSILDFLAKQATTLDFIDFAIYYKINNRNKL